MINLSLQQKEHSDFITRVNNKSGINIRKCYQCGKCSAGCSVWLNQGMDVPPDKILRMVQLGMEEEVLNTKTIWACVLCSTCTARCPRDIDLPQVIDTLRLMAKQRGINRKFSNANVFHEVFMNSIIKHGRLYELGFMVSLKLRQSGTMFTDLEIGIPALKSTVNRLPKLPPKLNNSGEIRKIMENCMRLEGDDI